MELKIPPPIVMALCAFLAWFWVSWLPEIPLPIPAHELAAAVVAIAGMGIIGISIRRFESANTTVNPLQPQNASTLVSVGIYQVSRNPMYVGLLLMLIAWNLYLAGTLALIIASVTFVFYITRFQILPEERVLESLFGEQYLIYKQRVRRWI